MVKLLVLKRWHRLSDPELERQVTDRISFRKLLGFSREGEVVYCDLGYQDAEAQDAME